MSRPFINRTSSCIIALALAASLPAMARPDGDRGAHSRGDARAFHGRAQAVQVPRGGHALQPVHSYRGGHAPRGFHAPRVFHSPRIVHAPLVYYGPRVVHSPPVYYGPRVILSAPLFYPPLAYPAPIVYGSRVSPPVVYVERDDLPPAPQAQAAPANDPSAWWYFCTDSNTYYPHVTECASPWQPVVPVAPPAASRPAP